MSIISTPNGTTRARATSCCFLGTRTAAARGRCSVASDWVGSCATIIVRRRDGASVGQLIWPYGHRQCPSSMAGIGPIVGLSWCCSCRLCCRHLTTCRRNWLAGPSDLRLMRRRYGRRGIRFDAGRLLFSANRAGDRSMKISGFTEPLLRRLFCRKSLIVDETIPYDAPLVPSRSW